MLFLTSFAHRFTDSLVRSSVYRSAYKLGILHSGQSVIVHALVIAILGSIIAFIIHKIHSTRRK